MDLLSSVQKDSSAKVLILSNVITIILAVVFSWSLMIILWGYWCQSVIIGFFNFLRILSLKDFSTKGMKISGVQGQPSVTTGIKFVIAIFFAIHYGIFHLVYAAFLGVFTFVSQSVSPVDFGYIFLMAIIFFLNHLFSFMYFKNKQKKKSNIGTVMFFPYARIFPMHLIIMFGLPFYALGGSLPVLVLFLLLKTGADLVMHYIEHKEQI